MCNILHLEFIFSCQENIGKKSSLKAEKKRKKEGKKKEKEKGPKTHYKENSQISIAYLKKKDK